MPNSTTHPTPAPCQFLRKLHSRFQGPSSSPSSLSSWALATHLAFFPQSPGPLSQHRPGLLLQFTWGLSFPQSPPCLSLPQSTLVATPCLLKYSSPCLIHTPGIFWSPDHILSTLSLCLLCRCLYGLQCPQGSFLISTCHPISATPNHHNDHLYINGSQISVSSSKCV